MVCQMAVVQFSEREVQAGLPVTTVIDLARQLEVPVDDVLAWLHLPPRTWARRKRAGVLDVFESDRIARLSRLVRRASAVLGGLPEARVWLTTPQRSLGRRRPLDVSSTEVGADEVFALLGRIEYGVF
jgi:putative toxin-antitoxin system antitoxin component (TIGR02293 family)